MLPPDCPQLILATGNPHKARELAELLAPLNLPLSTLADFPDHIAVEETGATLRENALLKARGYARQLSAWVLADDTGLEVDALGGEPGVRSARYAGEHATMPENRAKLLAALDGIPDDRRMARFVCELAIANPQGEIVLTASGVCHGRVRRSPSGEKGFGYDSLFEVAGQNKTLAELSPAKGHRGHAVRALIARIL